MVAHSVASKIFAKGIELTMFVNNDMTGSRHSSSSGVGIGSRAHDLGEHLSKDCSESAVIGLNDIREEP